MTKIRDIIEKTDNGETKKYKYFYGMSSEHAMKNTMGKKPIIDSEGRFIKVKYKGLRKYH